MNRILLLLCLLFFSGTALHARTDDSTKVMLEQFQQYVKLKDSVDKAMDYKTGTITLPNGIVQLNVPPGFKYLNKEQSKYIVEELWGNLPNEGIQGMLFPDYGGPLDDSSYAYIITYSEVGHIKDGDAKDIDYDDLMKQMKTDDAEENRQRAAMNLPGMYTHGWAAKPFYDDKKKVLHWAIDYTSDRSEEHTLNYKIIALGRKGMLTLNAIGTTDQLTMIKSDVDKVLGAANFTSGNRYQDFDSKVDDVAAWTVGGLVAGKILAKTAAGAGLLKFLKFIIIGVVALGGAIWRWITGRKKKEELVYEPVAPAQHQDQTPIPPTNS